MGRPADHIRRSQHRSTADGWGSSKRSQAVYCVLCTATSSSDSLCHGSTRTRPGRIGVVRSIGGRFRANGPVSRLLRHVRHLGIGAGAGNGSDEERHPTRPRRHIQGRSTYLTRVPGCHSAAVEQTPESGKCSGARQQGSAGHWGRIDAPQPGRRENTGVITADAASAGPAAHQKERSNQHQRRRGGLIRGVGGVAREIRDSGPANVKCQSCQFQKKEKRRARLTWNCQYFLFLCPPPVAAVCIIYAACQQPNRPTMPPPSSGASRAGPAGRKRSK